MNLNYLIRPLVRVCTLLSERVEVKLLDFSYLRVLVFYKARKDETNKTLIHHLVHGLGPHICTGTQRHLHLTEVTIRIKAITEAEFNHSSTDARFWDVN